jgi:peroxiredoxin
MNKKWMFPLGLIAMLCIAFYFYGKYHVAPGIRFSELSLSDLDGNPVNMDAYKGKKIALSFGASWCPNCLEEMRDINAVKDTELSDVEVIIISDEPLEKIRDLKERKGYDKFTFLKLNTPFSTIGINSIPTSYIINTKMRVMKESVGYVNWKDPSTAQHLKKIME